mmetsp:Transcript_11672/g.27428  ORF Transcript_11672/g.27428 Transcript_11672/m.27428 type:complete len:866 (+) Transcript_11672:95-2692(+)
MGISGLLKNLHPNLVPPPDHYSNAGGARPQRHHAHVRHCIAQFKGKSLAIDASSWLFKSGYIKARQLVESIESGNRNAEAEESYTGYILRRLEYLIAQVGVKFIYFTFDGIRIPLKAGTNDDREAKRQANIAEARRLHDAGFFAESEEKYRSSVKATSEMARVVAHAIEQKWGNDNDGSDDNVAVKCIWSPYEADAMLAKLCVDEKCHAVITEDSDVLVYSAVTRRPFPIIYKLDKNTGACDVVTMDWLLNPDFAPRSNNSDKRRRRRKPNNESSDSEESEIEVLEDKGGRVHLSEIEYDDLGFAPIRRNLPEYIPSKVGKRGKKREKSATILDYLRKFRRDEDKCPGLGVRLFVEACVLSGCDYVANRLSRIGPVASFRLLKESAHRKNSQRFEKLLQHGLPSGCVLLAEPKPSTVLDDEETQEKIGDGNNDEEEEEYDEFFSQPDTSRKSKNLYEEQLAKSTAVFFYHYVKDLATGCIVPLVPYRQSSVDDEDQEFGPVESNRPSIGRFDDGLPFIGSKASAAANRPAPMPPLSCDGPYSNPLNRGNGSLQWQRNSSAAGFRPTKTYNRPKSSQPNTIQRVTASSKPQKSSKSIDNFFLSNKNKVSTNKQKTFDVFGGPTIDIGSIAKTGLKTKTKSQKQASVSKTSVPSASNLKLGGFGPLPNGETSELSPIRLVKKKKRNRLQRHEEAASSYFSKAAEFASSQLSRQSPLSPSKLSRNQMHTKKSDAQFAPIKESPPVDESDLDINKLCDYFVDDPQGSENSRELPCWPEYPRRVSKSPPADTRNRYPGYSSEIDLCVDDRDGGNAKGRRYPLKKPGCSASRRPAPVRSTLLAGFAIQRDRGASKRKEASFTAKQQKKRVK